MDKYPVIQYTSDVRVLLDGIEMRDTLFSSWEFEWQILPADDSDSEGWNLQCSFVRPDANNGELDRGYGRKWYIESGSSAERVVFTAWMAINQIAQHELHESFTILLPDGRRVRLLDPHKPLSALAAGSRVLED